MPDTDRPLGVQISRMLKDRGVDTIFGIPGVHNQELYRGIEQAGITHVLARHEQGAGFMADGYARASGRPGVCYVITGPGLTNIMTPMGQAYSDSIPMLVISSCLDETAARKGQLHQMKDQRAAAETVSDWAVEARSAQAAYQLIDRALLELDHATRPRPKSISVPIAVLEANAEPAPTAHQIRRSRLRDSDLAPVQTLLRTAKRPLFIFGGGVRDASAVADLLQDTQAASFVTYAGRGLVAPDARHFFGSNLARPGSADVIASADLVIAVGTELAEVDLWRAKLGQSAPLVRVDIDADPLGDQNGADLKIRYDADLFLSDLRDMGVARASSGWTQAEVAQARAQWRAEVDADYPHIRPVADALRACLPEDTMIYSDMTQFAYAAKEVWDMGRPGHWHHPTGFGTLGYGLPAAIGGAVARAGKPTMAIAGDYGFQYTCNELATAVELQLPLPIILWDNGKLGAIESSMVAAQIAPNAVIQKNPDFDLLARAYGAGYEAPETLDDMQNTVRAAFDADKPTLIRLTPALVA